MPNNRLESQPVAADATATTALINNSSLSESDNTAYLAARSASSSTATDALPQLDIIISGNQGNVNISESQGNSGSDGSNSSSNSGETQITICGNSGNISIDEGGSDTSNGGDQQINIQDNTGTISINEGSSPPPCEQPPAPPQSEQPNPGGDQPPAPTQGQQPNPGGTNQQPPEQDGSGGGSGQSTGDVPTAAQVADLYSQIGTSNGVAAHFEGLADVDALWGNSKDEKFQSRRESVYLNNASLQWAGMSNMFGGGTVQTPDIQQSTPAEQVTYDQQQIALYQQQFLADEKAYTQGDSTGNAQLEQQLANDSATLSHLDSNEITNLPDNYYNHGEPEQYKTPDALGLPANTQSY